MTKKQEYLRDLREFPTDFIRRSAENPSNGMTKMHILLHYIVLRERCGSFKGRK